jgi:Undecaprenyl-phosphate glucose phosphotransferase
MQIGYLDVGLKAGSPSRAVTRELVSPSRGLPLTVFLDLVRAGDFALLLISGILTFYCARFVMPETAIQDGGYALCVLVTDFAVCAVLSRLKAYAFSNLTSRKKQFRALAVGLALGTIVLSGSIASLGFGLATAVDWPILWFAIAALLTVSLRLIIVPFSTHWHRIGRLAHRIALLGTAECAAEFVGDLESGSDGLKISGFYSHLPPAGEPDVVGAPYCGSIRELIQAGQAGLFDAVVVTLPADQSSLMTGLAERLKSLTADLYFCPGLGAELRRPVAALGGVSLLVVAQRPLSDWQVVQKALVDRVGAAVLLVLLAPVLLAVAALVRLESPGPALFRQTRIGFNNLPFTCFKFRTMYDHAADLLADRQTTRNDERVTRSGRWLRRFSIDELPQLLNVLRGEMSLVGPRPHAPNTKADGRLFADVVADYATRHRVKPGITGWAQVNGWRGETTTVEQIDQRIWHDLYYIRNWSLQFDFRILLLTAVRGFGGPQAF